jgi:hypothetical protein
MHERPANRRFCSKASPGARSARRSRGPFRGLSAPPRKRPGAPPTNRDSAMAVGLVPDGAPVRHQASGAPQVAFYTTHFGFTVRSSAAPAFADVVRGNLRLLLSGPKSSAGRPMRDGAGRSPAAGPHPLRRRRHRRGDRAAACTRPDVPQRPRQRAGRPADPARGPGRQPDRAVPAGRRVAVRRRA